MKNLYTFFLTGNTARIVSRAIAGIVTSLFIMGFLTMVHAQSVNSTSGTVTIKAATTDTAVATGQTTTSATPAAVKWLHMPLTLPTLIMLLKKKNGSRIILRNITLTCLQEAQ